MVDVEDRIDRTRSTPSDLTGLDVERIVTRGRRQRAGLRVGGAVVGVAAVGMAGVLAAGLGTPPPPEVATAPPAPSATTAASWSTFEVPMPARSTPVVGTTADGDLVVFPDSRLDDRDTNGVVVDRDTGETVTIPAMPGSPAATGPGGFAWTQIVDDRVVVVTRYADDTVAGAWYDLGAGAWTQIPPTDAIDGWAEAVGFDGDTLALVQTGFRDDEEPRPTVARYDLADDAWTKGAVPPFGTRSHPAVASQGGQVLLHGGNLTGEETDLGTPIDGGDDATARRSDTTFLYDVSADSWTELPRTPLSGGVARSAVWLTDHHLAILSQGVEELVGPGSGVSPDHAVAVLDTRTTSWTEIAPPADLVPNARISYRGSGDARTTQSVLTATDATTAEGAPSATAIWDPASGEWIAGPEVVDLAGAEHTSTGWVVLSGHPRTTNTLSAHVRTPDGRWAQPDQEQPPARTGSTTIAVGDDVYVIGGEPDPGPANIDHLDLGPATGQ